MTPELEKTKALLCDLVGSFIERPAALRVECQSGADGAAYWMMQGDLADEGKLVGAGGAHVKAVARLVESIGAARGQAFTFRLITVGDPQRRPERQERDVIEYDPRPARDLLCRTLEALDIGEFKVEAGPGAGARRSLTFVFTVKTARYIDADTLDALGTLFRAIAKKDGVRFAINLSSA